MARVSGNVSISGKIGDMTFFVRNGKTFARKNSSLDKDKLHSDPRFKRTMESATEFGAASTIGKAVVNAIGPWHKKTADTGAWNRLKKRIHKALKQGPGIRGQREFLPANALHHLKGLEWREDYRFDSFFSTTATPLFDPASGMLEWNIPALAIDDDVTPPDGATHFSLFLLGLVLPSYAYNPIAKKYMAIPPVERLTILSSQSVSVALDQPVAGPLHLSMQMPALPGSEVIPFTGIIFTQEVAGKSYPLRQGATMRVG